jgi:predicted esterase
MPVGITASGKDAIVPPQSVLRLAGILEKVHRPVMLIYRKDMGHTSKPEDAQRVIDFVLDRALRPRNADSKTSPKKTIEVTP